MDTPLILILVSVVPVRLPRFPISSLPSVCVFFITSISFFKSWSVSLTFLACFFLIFFCYLWEISSFHLIFVCYLHFFMAVVHLLFMFLYHFHIVPFKVDFFYFFWRRVFKSTCCMIPGIWCCNVAFQIVGGILALVPAQLLLQMQPKESLHWSKLCCVILSGSPQGRRKISSLVFWVCGLSAGAETPSRIFVHLHGQPSLFPQLFRPHLLGLFFLDHLNILSSGSWL